MGVGPPIEIPATETSIADIFRKKVNLLIREFNMGEDDGLILGHMRLCLDVTDLGKSRDFYSKLGFKVSGGNPEENWLIMKSDRGELHLFQGHISGNCINFRGGDVYAIAKHLRDRGLEMAVNAHQEEDGSDGAWITDPDGNQLYFNTCEFERIQEMRSRT